MKKTFLVVFLGAWLFSHAQVERVVDLPINPQLYHQHKHLLDKGKRLTNDNYYIVPDDDPLPLPFVDDFSVNHLKAYDVSGLQIVDSVARTLELTEDTLVFRYVDDTAWSYSYDTTLDRIDSVALPSISLVLHDDSFDLLIPTDTITGWPTYYNNYTFDTATGAALDSTFVPYTDSVLYSTYYGIADANALWLDNQVYINNTYATNRLSYGVATFDGLNEFGLPHRGQALASYGGADTLTSKPINLEGLGISDNVFFSIAFEPKGFGDEPEAIDSLVVEFKVLGNTWEQMCGWAGDDGIISNPTFRDTMFQIVSPFHLVSDFQFRIRNKATIAGNNDHWHIDYVYLNSNRNPLNTDINDVAILDPVENLLKNYTSMPWYQYEGYEATERKDTIKATLKNNYNSTQAITFDYRIYEQFTNTELSTAPPLLGFNMPPGSIIATPNHIAASRAQYNPATPPDSVRLNVEFSITENPTSITTENNVVTTSVLFDNYFSYDDGSAERAYGLEGPGLKKFAYEFNLNEPDTLRALQFHFSQITEDMLLREITLVVWSEILTGEDTLYIRERTPFHYIPERNGFTQYVLDTPVLVQGKFYVGWQQLFPENIQLGLDVNNSATNRMWYFTNGTWKPSAIEGAPMIRPIVGKDRGYIGTGVKNPVVKNKVTLYPNPSEDVIYLRAERQPDRLEIFDMHGKLVRTLNGATTQIDIRDLNRGMYIIRVFNGKHQPQSLRFVKI